MWQNCEMIPCGKCKGCRIDQANDFATRAALESKLYKQNCFLTITYDNKHLPKNRSLCKKDLQDFWKKLRKKGYKIRYMACGEYGPRTLRPHYHAIVFNYWPTDAKLHSRNILKEPLFTSKELNKIWGKGYIIVGKATYETAAYVARYTFKKSFGITKLTWKNAKKEPEFTTTSRKPGIGAYILKTPIWQTIKKTGNIIIPSKTGPRIKRIPTFLKNKWKDFDNRKEYFKKSEELKKQNLEKTKQTLSNTSLNYWEYSKLLTQLQDEKLKRLDKRGDK